MTEDGVPGVAAGTRLAEMPVGRMPQWLETTMADYVTERMAAGESREQAEANKQASLDQWFPGGRPLPEHRVWDVVDATDTVVGFLWIGPFTAGGDAWWVFNVEIDPDHRRQGHARRALELGHEYARGHGAASIGLNVFGHNPGAQHLYRALGYDVTAMQMRLPLT